VTSCSNLHRSPVSTPKPPNSSTTPPVLGTVSWTSHAYPPLTSAVREFETANPRPETPAKVHA